MSDVRVVVADDNADLRDVLRLNFQLAGGVEVVGEAADAASTVALVDEMRPDVLLVDLFMPGRDHLDVIEHVHRCHRDVRIIVLTGWVVVGERERALARGVSDYLVKSADLLRTVVPAVLAGAGADVRS